MTMKKIDLGALGWTVARHVREYREARNLGYAELSRRLDGLGRRIPPLGLRQIEKGERRVDVDDLDALAQALHIELWLLLMPHRLSPEETIERADALDEIYRQTGQTP
jgi:transcriptional regulator with XRE-family HTH domain